MYSTRYLLQSRLRTLMRRSIRWFYSRRRATSS